MKKLIIVFMVAVFMMSIFAVGCQEKGYEEEPLAKTIQGLADQGELIEVERGVDIFPPEIKGKILEEIGSDNVKMVYMPDDAQDRIFYIVVERKLDSGRRSTRVVMVERSENSYSGPPTWYDPYSVSEKEFINYYINKDFYEDGVQL